MPNKKAALFLDRDGTIVFDRHYGYKIEDMELVPGAREGLKLAVEKGYSLYLVTNQSGIGRGYFTMEDTVKCNEHIFRMLDLPEESFAGICIAPETPEQPSEYRKPSPKYILERIELDSLDPSNCHMIGDKPADWEAGINAKIHSIAVTTGKEITAEHREFLSKHDAPIFDSLRDIADSLPDTR